MNKKIKLLVWGDAVTQTGFSRVLHSILENLPTEKYAISWLAINYWGDPHPYKKYKIYPAMAKGETYGFNRLEELCMKVKPDVVFCLNDIWIIDPFIDELIKVYTNPNFEHVKVPRVVAYFPIDAKDHDASWYKNVGQIVPVVYNQFGESVAKIAEPKYEYNIIPHGVDSSVFKRIYPTRREAKLDFFKERPELENSFIVLNGNRNQPRKRLDVTMQAFSMFAKDKKDAYLYMHCGVIDSHIDVLRLSRRYGIEKQLIISSLAKGPQQVSVPILNKIYNACDVGVNTSLGEGFGLVNVEHAVTGAPQIVGAHSANVELYSDCGLLVPVSQSLVIEQIMTTGGLVHPEDVANAMQKLYEDKELYNSLSQKCIDKFSSPEYSWKASAVIWDRLFTEVTNVNNVPK